ncbi:gamma-glutamylcyclotransferase [Rhizobium sp. Root483D2]|uniref:gamma-glutamylcyclotransferase n=1 Tax=Rhizobium sp. Root483D2 TaxID=1736545 RepID=UPI000714CFE8|nr:gamma-glutamylcyclotransferase [Rhizobium sp. Root483D2]KQY48609.1 hypothetical protein ASD32_09470 [Rhizobium sp. Root483D2]
MSQRAPKQKRLSLTPELVAQTMIAVDDEGPEPGWHPITEEQLDHLVERLEREAGDQPIWVFAYGSLIWNPGFLVASQARAVAYGWHRAFSLRIKRFRANSRSPGLMMALERGGSCSGLVLKLPCSTKSKDLRALLLREIKYAEVSSMVRWIPVKTPAGTQRALAFWASSKSSLLTKKLALAEVAILLAQACGPAGSCAEYLYNTVVDLGLRGIYDRNLWALQAMVAERIGRDKQTR